MAGERYKTSYGSWAGNPRGSKPDLELCCEEVVDTSTNWSRHRQCGRKRGFGPDEAYCKQHDPEVAAKRQAETEARQAIAYRKQRMEWAGPRFYAVLEQIANGHNDPRTIAAEAIQSFRPLPYPRRTGMSRALPAWTESLVPVDMDGAARLLGISRRFLVDVIAVHKHYEPRGNRKVFYPEHIAALREALCHSKSKTETGKASGMSLEPSTASAFEEALKLATGKPPLSNARSSKRNSGNVIPMAKRP